MMIKVNHMDLKNECEKLGEEEWELTKKLRAVQARRRVVKKVLIANDEGAQRWIVDLPVEALPERSAEMKKVNWKKLVMEMFARYNMPMSAELICHKLWLHYPAVGFDRRMVVQNVSAALSNLEGKDQKLFRTRYNGRKGYIYGLKHFFDFNIKLKPYYYQQWKREEGEEEEIVITEKKEIYAGQPVSI